MSHSHYDNADRRDWKKYLRNGDEVEAYGRFWRLVSKGYKAKGKSGLLFDTICTRSGEFRTFTEDEIS